MIRLTNLIGNPVYVGKDWIQMVRAPLDREFAADCNAVIVLSGESIAVLETVAEVIGRLEVIGTPVAKAKGK